MDLDLCWQPHKDQAEVKNALFAQNHKKIFLECGRKFGKTEFLAYMLYRYALLNPNSACYFIAPFQKQARELIWANNRLQNFFLPLINPTTERTFHGHTREEAHQILKELTDKYGVEALDTQMRIRFGNGSFIKLDGADQHQAYRGVNPHLIVYDEFKDHHPKFHDGMDPNLATHDAPLIIVGTPPEGDEDNDPQFCELADFCSIDGNSSYFNKSSYCNPHISAKWLDQKKLELVSRGREDVWLREYMAQRVRAGSRSIFPMFEHPDPERNIYYTKHVIRREEAKQKVLRHHKSWDFFLSFDPASATTFAVLFGAIHKRTKEIILLGEVYETRKGEMSTGRVFPKAISLLDGYPVLAEEIRMIYDAAATWFQNEVSAQFGYGLEASMKDIGKKKEIRLNLIKDLLLDGFLIVSEDCPKFIWEMRNYRADEKGKIPKENDHLLDGFRYALANFYYDQVPPKVVVVEETRRFYTPETETRSGKEPFGNIMAEYYI